MEPCRQQDQPLLAQLEMQIPVFPEHRDVISEQDPQTEEKKDRRQKEKAIYMMPSPSND